MRLRSALVAVALTGPALGACQVKRVSEMSYTELKQTADTIKDRCRAQGIKDGTVEWQPCLTQEAAREMAVRDRIVAARDSGGTVVCNRVGNTTICN